MRPGTQDPQLHSTHRLPDGGVPRRLRSRCCSARTITEASFVFGNPRYATSVPEHSGNAAALASPQSAPLVPPHIALASPNLVCTVPRSCTLVDEEHAGAVVVAHRADEGGERRHLRRA